MAVSDARRLKVSEQARADSGEQTAEVLMELVVPTGQDMATKADLDAAVGTLTARIDGRAPKEFVLRLLMIALLPVSIGMLGILGSIMGLSLTG